MDTLFTVFYRQLNKVNQAFERYLAKEIDWNSRLICILGARGSGKTTLILQHIKKTFGSSTREALYVSLDHIWFSGNSLYELGEQFVLNGGTTLFLDEVHKYNNWSKEIKNLYDGFPDLKIVFTGSSILEINKGNADLSRRAVQYFLFGMSFREFLIFEKTLEIEPITFNEILTNHIEIAQDISQKIKILPHFNEYLKYGYFPYYKEGKHTYFGRLAQTINTVLETDLSAAEKIDYYSIDKIKRLLYIMSSLVPFTPNITQLSQQVGTSRNSLLSYIHFLEKAQIINTLMARSGTKGILTKPEKIYLGNTNLNFMFVYENKPDKGNLRETFFCNQLKVTETVNYSSSTDFTINNKYHFEIGGKNKGKEQIFGLENAFLALDNIETGYFNKIPLWLFGFLY